MPSHSTLLPVSQSKPPISEEWKPVACSGMRRARASAASCAIVALSPSDSRTGASLCSSTRQASIAAACRHNTETKTKQVFVSHSTCCPSSYEH